MFVRPSTDTFFNLTNLIVMQSNKFNLNLSEFLQDVKSLNDFDNVMNGLYKDGIQELLKAELSHHLGETNLFFLLSATIQVLLTAIAIGVYVYQLALINSIDFSEPVLTIQEKISKLKISTLNVTRLLFLQLPLWTTFYWNAKMFVAENWMLWIMQGMITLSFALVALWLFFNIKYENRNKKWFQWIFRGKEWQPILQSMELLNQIDNYQEQDEVNTSR
jgi:hypothetical protein